ncbi:hypothetical protein GCM10023306_18390 [Novosphingobium ginsenosidimutans]
MGFAVESVSGRRKKQRANEPGQRADWAVRGSTIGKSSADHIRRRVCRKMQAGKVLSHPTAITLALRENRNRSGKQGSWTPDQVRGDE